MAVLRTVLCLALALCSSDAAVKTKTELETISTTASTAKTAWYDMFYYGYWTLYCSTTEGTDATAEEIADCVTEQAEDNYEAETEWRWRGTTTGFVEATKDCSLDEGFCTKAGATSFSDLFSIAVGPTEAGDVTAYTSACVGGEEVDCDDDSCAALSDNICCCEDTSEADSCTATTPDTQCTGESDAYTNPVWATSAICPTGVIDTIPAIDALDFDTNPNLMLEAFTTRSMLAFHAINAGDVTFSSSTVDACEVPPFTPALLSLPKKTPKPKPKATPAPSPPPPLPSWW